LSGNPHAGGALGTLSCNFCQKKFQRLAFFVSESPIVRHIFRYNQSSTRMKFNTPWRTALHFALSLTLLLSLSTSCSPVLYTAVGQNVPLLQEKGETSFGGGYAETDAVSGAYLQFATAIGSGLAVGALFDILSSSRGGDWSGRGTYMEGMVGKFGSFNRGPFVWEVYTGLGYATIKNKFESDYVNASYIKPFIQPSIGISGKIAEFAITPRIALVNYTSESYNFSDVTSINSVADFFDKKGTTFVFEPGATLRIGYKSAKIQVQYSYSTFSYDSENWSPVDNEYISIGLQVLISQRFVNK